MEGTSKSEYSKYIITLVLALVGVIGIALLKAFVFPSDGKSKKASEEAKKFNNPDNYTPKLKSYEFIEATFVQLRKHKDAFKTIKFGGKDEILYIFDMLDKETKTKEMAFAFDEVIQKMELKPSKPFPKCNTIEFTNLLLNKIRNDEVAHHKTTKNIQKSEFIKHFALMYETKGDNTSIINSFKGKNPMLSTSVDTRKSLKVNLKIKATGKNITKVLHLPEVLLISFDSGAKKTFKNGKIDNLINNAISLNVESKNDKGKVASTPYKLSGFTFSSKSGKFFSFVRDGKKFQNIGENKETSQSINLPINLYFERDTDNKSN
ncbi:hypothetical protein H312_00432, partial [Anncaliia algerae PRA339]